MFFVCEVRLHGISHCVLVFTSTNGMVLELYIALHCIATGGAMECAI